jgi:hypothetical protein
LLTPEQSRRLRLPEALELGAGEERVAAGLGSPLLEALIEQERGRQPMCWARPELPPTPEGSARSLAAAWTPRNGVAGPPSLGVAELGYLWVAAQWTFEADERSEGLAFARGRGPPARGPLCPRSWTWSC